MAYPVEQVQLLTLRVQKERVERKMPQSANDKQKNAAYNFGNFRFCAASVLLL